MKVADVRLLGGTDRSPMERCQVVLREVQGPRMIELWFLPSVAEWTASALRGVEIPWGSSPYHLGLQHLRKNGERVTGVLLETLHDGTLRALLTIAGERGTRQIAGRPADSVTLAVLYNLFADLVGGIRVTVLEEEVVQRPPSRPPR